MVFSFLVISPQLRVRTCVEKVSQRSDKVLNFKLISTELRFDNKHVLINHKISTGKTKCTREPSRPLPGLVGSLVYAACVFLFSYE